MVKFFTPKSLRNMSCYGNSPTKENNLQFRGGNPGAVQYGNFINYYQFHPPNQRIELLPKDIWNTTEPMIALDIGCNTGDLSMDLYKFLTNNGHKSCRILAIDIDPILIERAKENNSNPDIEFKCVDFMNADQRKLVLSQFLHESGVNKFTTCFCFSITMWIHLNYGDLGLKRFLMDICKESVMVVIEPQPWKCYKSAVKRMKSSSDQFPEYKNLKIRNNVENVIEDVLLGVGVLKVTETNNTQWGRKISIFKVPEISNEHYGGL